MTSFRFSKYDLSMVLWLMFIIFVPQIPIFVDNGIELFTFWHYMLISSAYGGYVTLRLFVHFQIHLAQKKGMLREYDEINRIEKKTRELTK